MNNRFLQMAAIAVLAVSASAMAQAGQDNMKHDGMMQQDSMKHDDAMKHDDGMMKHKAAKPAMKHKTKKKTSGTQMKHNDGMKHDGMKHDDMNKDQMKQ